MLSRCAIRWRKMIASTRRQPRPFTARTLLSTARNVSRKDGLGSVLVMTSQTALTAARGLTSSAPNRRWQRSRQVSGSRYAICLESSYERASVAVINNSNNTLTLLIESTGPCGISLWLCYGHLLYYRFRVLYTLKYTGSAVCPSIPSSRFVRARKFRKEVNRNFIIFNKPTLQRGEPQGGPAYRGGHLCHRSCI